MTCFAAALLIVAATAPAAARGLDGARKIAFSTVLGAEGTQTVTDVTTDPRGNVYVVGQTVSGTRFPTTEGAFQRRRAGESDAFIAKFRPSGRLVFATLLGGGPNERDEGGDENALAIGVDQDGSLYVTGSTTSDDFPTKNAFQSERGGDAGGSAADVYVAKLDRHGSSIEWSTFLGGIQPDGPAGLEVARDGSVWIAGTTESSGFPVRRAFQPEFGGLQDGFVAHLDASGQLDYSTFLGGAGYDSIRGLAVRAGRPYVTGNTYMWEEDLDRPFPTTARSFMPKPVAGEDDTFVTKFGADPSRLAYSTFLGGRGPYGDPAHDDAAWAIAVDAHGRAVVTGDTESRDFPTRHASQKRLAGERDVYITRLTRDGSALVNSTYFGGTFQESTRDLAVDGKGRVHISGYTHSAALPRRWALQTVIEGYWDAFVASFTRDGRLAFASYVGAAKTLDDGIETESLNALHAAGGDLYVGGYSAGTWPLVRPHQRQRSGVDGVLMRLPSLQAAPLHATRVSLRPLQVDLPYVELRGRVRDDGFGPCRRGRGVTGQVKRGPRRWFGDYTVAATRRGRFHQRMWHYPAKFRAFVSSSVERADGRWHACAAAASRVRRPRD